MFDFHGGQIITLITCDRNDVATRFKYQTVAKVMVNCMILITQKFLNYDRRHLLSDSVTYSVPRAVYR